MSPSAIKRRIPALLRKTANEYLASGNARSPGVQSYSCCAVIAADNDGLTSEAALDYLVDLGCPTWYAAFNEFPQGPERQGARFLWLHMAALVYKDVVS